MSLAFPPGMRNAAEVTMKKNIASPKPVRLAPRTIFATVSAIALVMSTLTYAQPTSSSPDPKAGAEMTGTIKEYTAGSSLVLATLAPSEPVQFKLSKNVTYADADGKIVEAAGLTTNQKVRVHYTKVGGDNVADKVTLIGN
jgi:hypothetical protein